jgi:tetratricopeptide (TPR) repeat protein
LIIILFSIQSLSADYNQAVKELKNNNIDAAILNFEEAVSDGDNVKKSILYLAILREYQQAKPEETYTLIKENFVDHELIITSLWEIFFSKIGNHQYEDFFEQLEDELETVKYNQLKDYIYEANGQFYKNIAEYDESVEFLSKIKHYYNWQVAGAFENTSGSGFDKNYGPIENPKSNSVFYDQYNAKVNWFESSVFDQGEWQRFEYFFDITDAIMYAQTFIKAEKDEVVEGSIGVSGSVKVWANDQIVFKEKKEVNNGQDSYIFEVGLKKGWNKILVQIGSSENPNANFFFKLRNKNGETYNHQEVSSSYKEYPKLSGEKIKVIEQEHVRLIKSMIAKEPDELVYKLLLFQQYKFNNNFTEANKVRKEIHELMPNTLLSNLLDMEYHLISRNSTLFNKALEAVKAYEEKYPMTLSNLWQQEMDNNNIPALESLLEKMKQHPKYFGEGTILEKEINLDAKKGNYQSMMKKCIRGNREFPNNFFFANILILYYYSGTKEYSKAIDIIEDYLENNHSYQMTLMLSEIYLQTGRKDKGIGLIEDYLENFPHAIQAYKELANIYFSAEDNETALEYIKKGLEIAPFYSNFHSFKARIHQQNGEIAEAAESYKKAIEYNPLDYDSRNSLANLDGEINIYNKFEAPDLDSVYSSNPGTDSEHDLTILHNEIQAVAYKNGGYEKKYYMLIKANNSKGIDLIKEYQIPVYNNETYKIDEAYLLKENNSRLKAEESGQMLVFPNIEVGDAIKIIYRVQTYTGYSLTNHFWDDFQMDLFYPVKTSKYLLAVESGKKFEYKVTNNDQLKPEKSKIGNFDVYSWEMNDLEELTYEVNMPNTPDIATTVYVSSIPSWDYVVDWYKDMTMNRLESHDYYKSILDEVIDDNESDYNKAYKIYQYIVKEIRYSYVPFRQSGYIPQKSNVLLDDKLGDCKDISTLFVNLCREAGMDANLVLVNTRDNGLESMPLPSVNFDHCIAQINLNNEPYFVETTSEFIPFAAVPFSMEDQLILPIRDETKQLENLAPSKNSRNIVKRFTTISFEDDELITDKKSIKYGGSAAKMRNSYLYLTEKEKRERMEKAIIDEDPSLELLKLDFISGLEDVSDSVVYNYKYLQPQKFIEVGDMKIFEIEWTDKFYSTDFVANSNRIYPIELYNYFDNKEEFEILTISAPAGTKIKEKPDNVKISNEFFDYNLKFEEKGNKIECVRYFKINKDIIDKDEYQLFKDDIKKIVKSDKTSIVYGKG